MQQPQQRKLPCYPSSKQLAPVLPLTELLSSTPSRAFPELHELFWLAFLATFAKRLLIDSVSGTHNRAKQPFRGKSIIFLDQGHSKHGSSN